MRIEKFHKEICMILEKDLLHSNNRYKTLKFFRKNIVTVTVWLYTIKNFYNNQCNSVEDLVRRANTISSISRPSIVNFVKIAVSKGYLIIKKNENDKRKYNVIPAKITLKEFEKWSDIFRYTKS